MFDHARKIKFVQELYIIKFSMASIYNSNIRGNPWPWVPCALSWQPHVPDHTFHFQELLPDHNTSHKLHVFPLQAKKF